MNWLVTFQGGISCHEATLKEEDLVSPGLLVSSESEIMVLCESFQHNENINS